MNNETDFSVERVKALELIDEFKNIEPTITQELVNLTELKGGKMEGLDFRLKSKESLTRKLAFEGVNVPMNDVLRYTVIFEESNFTKNTLDIIEQLKRKGFTKVEVDVKKIETRGEYSYIETTFYKE